MQEVYTNPSTTSLIRDAPMLSYPGDFDILRLYRVAQKSKPLPNDQKIVLKPVNEIRFIRQIKV